MAGAGFKTFTTGEVLLAADVNTYLMQQTVMVFDDATARTTAIASPSEGMLSYLKDTDSVEKYDGSSWVAVGGGSSPLTTKGDIWGYSTTDARIPVGANGTVLTADSAETLGVKWAAAGGASFVGVGLTKTSNQSISSDVNTAITFTSEYYDTDSFHDNSTNTSRITIPTGKGGKYLIFGYLTFQDNGTGSRAAHILLNGSTRLITYGRVQAVTETGSFTTVGGCFVRNLSAGDYIELQGYQKSGGALNVYGDPSPDDWRSQFGVTYLGA